MNEIDLDLELERRLRSWYRQEFEEGVRAPEALRVSVAAIPRTLPVAGRRFDRRGRITLLAAAAILVVAGGAVASGFLSPAPSVFVIAPSMSPQPTASPSPPASSVAPSDVPVVVPSVGPSSAPSFVPVTGPSVAATWRPAGSMAVGRVAHTATLLADGRVLVTGGSSMDRALSSAELWDPATRSFTATGSMHAERIGAAATLLRDGRVLVVGGDGPDKARASAEIWDPATGSFSDLIATPDNRGSGLTATTLADGRVLVVGGVKCVATPPRQAPSCGDGLATLIWDPATGSFSPGPRLNEARDWGTATLLSDGRVVLIGGTGLAMDMAESAEVWDPSLPAFQRVGEPHDYRSGGLSATVLPDGRVLITGGDTGDLTRNDAWFGPLGSAEVWIREPVCSSVPARWRPCEAVTRPACSPTARSSSSVAARSAPPTSSTPDSRPPRSGTRPVGRSTMGHRCTRGGGHSP